jgi:hypothetical protein
MISIFTKYYPADQFKKNVMGGEEERRGAYRVLVRKPEGRRPLGKPRRKWEDNVKMDLREVGPGAMMWIDPSQSRERWRALVMKCVIP